MARLKIRNHGVGGLREGQAVARRQRTGKRKILCLFLEKSPKDLQRRDCDLAKMVLSGLFDGWKREQGWSLPYPKRSGRLMSDFGVFLSMKL